MQYIYIQTQESPTQNLLSITNHHTCDIASELGNDWEGLVRLVFVANVLQLLVSEMKKATFPCSDITACENAIVFCS